MIELLWSPYLTWTLIILIFERMNTWFFTRLIIFAINDALAQINTFFLHAFLQIIFILRRRVFTTHANGIRATDTTMRTIDITWTIYKNRYLWRKIRYSNHKKSTKVQISNLRYNRSVLCRIPWGSSCRSKLRCSPSMQVRIVLHILQRCLHL